MYRLGRKVVALALAAAVAVSVASPAFAAGSPVKGVTEGSKTTVTSTTTGKDTVAVDKISNSEKKAAIPSKVVDQESGKTYKVDLIKTGAITKKYDRVSIFLRNTTKVSAKIMKSKKAKKTKKIVILKVGDTKLKASQFDKKAFKGYKGKIKVKKSAMTKKEFKKLVKKLRKGGFKGKIVYKN